MRSRLPTALSSPSLLAACVSALLVLAGPTSAQGQSLLDQIEAKVDQRSGELERVDALLADPSDARRIAAMEALLASGDPEFIQRARVVGLTSEDSRLRSAALKAIFDAGGIYHAEFDIPESTSGLTKIFDWLDNASGSWSEDRRTGFVPIAIGKYNEEDKCWEWLNLKGRCVFQLAGEVVHTGYWNRRLKAGATMKLDDKGTLTGGFLVDGAGKPVTIRIPLIE